MGKIANRFAANIKNPRNALQEIVTLQNKGEYFEAIDAFDNNFIKNSSKMPTEQAGVAQLKLFQSIMEDARIFPDFKIILHDHISKEFGTYFVAHENVSIDEYVPVEFYYFTFDPKSLEAISLREKRLENITKNINAHKYALPGAPCFVLPLEGYFDFYLALHELPPAGLQELKQKLSSLVAYEQWKSLSSPQWLAPDRVEEVHRIIQETTERYLGVSLLPQDYNEIFEKSPVPRENKEDSDGLSLSGLDPECEGYLVIAPEFEFEMFIDPVNSPELREKVVPHYNICTAFNMYDTIETAVFTALSNLENLIEENPAAVDNLVLGVSEDVDTDDHMYGTTLSLYNDKTSDILVETTINWAPMAWTPTSMHDIIYKTFSQMLLNSLKN